MAKKKAISKSQAVRDYLKTHRGAMSGEIAAALKKQGIKITPSYVANIKTKINKTHTSKKAAKKEVVEVAAPAVVEKPVKAADTVTLEQVKNVTQAVKTMGGFQRMTEVLEVIRDLGGVKKFKDLAAAMSVNEPDAIPY